VTLAARDATLRAAIYRLQGASTRGYYLVCLAMVRAPPYFFASHFSHGDKHATKVSWCAIKHTRITACAVSPDHAGTAILPASAGLCPIARLLIVRPRASHAAVASRSAPSQVPASCASSCLLAAVYSPHRGVGGGQEETEHLHLVGRASRQSSCGRREGVTTLSAEALCAMGMTGAVSGGDASSASSCRFCFLRGLGAGGGKYHGRYLWRYMLYKPLSACCAVMPRAWHA